MSGTDARQSPAPREVSVTGLSALPQAGGQRDVKNVVRETISWALTGCVKLQPGYRADVGAAVRAGLLGSSPTPARS